MRLGYILREALRGLGRNLTMTIALVITTAISVGLLVTGVLVTQMTAETKDIYLEKVEVMVQLSEEISATDTSCINGPCAQLREKLEKDPGVEEVNFRNQQQSYERFVEVFKESDPLLVEETSADAIPAALHVRLVDPTDSRAIDKIADDPAVDTIVDQGDEVRAATSNLDSIRNATFILALIQALAAVFLIANMVQIAAYNRSTEMSIMRMVGATRWFTSAPFVVEAVLAVCAGVVAAGIGVFVGKETVVDPALAELYASQLLAPARAEYIWTSLPIIGLVASAFAGVVALVTLRGYVRK
ncbi:cell division protein FtsX [Corynebacterium phocae]|uniref:Cell division protein FtsX n=1 Tax=Corynebacterium phocae TaxID=161895 RepID=A0A1L7D4E0_9CORY|nr:permease-like cell division protein FtsX [Corynebacterium phocae]APT93046.1 cell division protein FtsX [Corynebacterium phocae]KAA8722349.1 ABC transporter permease [Corynebacterium phocae]